MQFQRDTLSGIDNKRLGCIDCTNNEGTAAWANSEELTETSHINIPSDYQVDKAKNWVDNGSQL